MKTRREFVQHLGAAALLLGVGGCRTRGAAEVPDAQVLPKPPVTSRVAVVRPSTYPSLEAAVKDVVAKAGGLSFIKPGQSVLLKPAVNSSRPYPATSDPEVVFLLARMVKEAGGEPFIADRTMFLRSTALAFHELKLDTAAREAGVSCQPLDHAEVAKLAHPLATHWGGTIPVYRPVAQADHVINLCTPRTHQIGDFTMALKNLVGVVDGGARMRMHFPNGFKERLAELSLVVPPSLVLMDGRQGFTDGGPDEGDLARPGFLAASSDPLATDAVGLGFLRLAGANDTLMTGRVWDLPVMKRAAELGVGATSLEHLAFVGLGSDDEAALRRQLA